MKKEFEIDLTEQELLDYFIDNDKPYDMLKIADKALGEVSWHDSMPNNLRLKYIAMLQKHIDAFMKDMK